MSKTIKQMFDEQLAHITPNTQLVKALQKFLIGFEMRNQDHIEFFGGNLTGVHKVRFHNEDRDQWFEEILQVNEFVLDSALDSVPSVDRTRIVISDVMNLSFVWLMHKLYHSKILSPSVKEQAMIDVASIMQIKFLTSRLGRHFKFPADPKIAAAVYAQLSYKYLIKQQGSWKKLLDYRSREIISAKGIHFAAIRDMIPDESVTYLLSDSQGRIRDMLKNIYDLHLRTRDSSKRILTTSNVIEHDGEMVLKDVTKTLPSYIRYIHSILGDGNSFIRGELTDVVKKLVHTMSPNIFEKTLRWMSQNYRQQGAQVIEKSVDDLLMYSMDYLQLNRTSMRNTTDLAFMLSKLRGSFTSSRNSDELLMKTKANFETMVTHASGSKHPGIVASARTGVMLYIVARTLTMNYYSSAAKL